MRSSLLSMTPFSAAHPMSATSTTATAPRMREMICPAGLCMADIDRSGRSQIAATAATPSSATTKRVKRRLRSGMIERAAPGSGASSSASAARSSLRTVQSQRTKRREPLSATRVAVSATSVSAQRSSPPAHRNATATTHSVARKGRGTARNREA